MKSDEETKLFIDISKNLGEINTKLSSLCDVIAKHEQRISNLEQGKMSMKDECISWLIKGLIASIAIIGSLTGSASLIQKLCGL